MPRDFSKDEVRGLRPFSPPARKEENPVAKVLREAAASVRKDGWTQTPFKNGGWGKKCAGLAIADQFGVHTSVREEATATFSRYVGARNVPHWNDAPGRTAEEVISALESCADSLSSPIPSGRG